MSQEIKLHLFLKKNLSESSTFETISKQQLLPDFYCFHSTDEINQSFKCNTCLTITTLKENEGKIQNFVISRFFFQIVRASSMKPAWGLNMWVVNMPYNHIFLFGERPLSLEYASLVKMYLPAKAQQKFKEDWIFALDMHMLYWYLSKVISIKFPMLWGSKMDHRDMWSLISKFFCLKILLSTNITRL